MNYFVMILSIIFSVSVASIVINIIHITIRDYADEKYFIRMMKSMAIAAITMLIIFCSVVYLKLF